MAYNILYKISKKILLLSSTFLDPKAFCHSSGIPEKFFNLIKMPSMFPKENRPIIVRAVGKMTDGKINELMPKLSKVVNDILKQHENDKGIIHVPSYKIARGLGIHDQSKRLLLHTNSSRSEILRFFMESKDPLVMVSPSMYEGLDLRDNLSRFQIIVKIPWLGLDDVYVKMMSRKDFRWYIWRTAIKIVQGYGRSVRSEEDYAVTYVLDADFPDFIDRNKRLFPEYFLEAIKYEKEAV
jgi:Rad3-related DNA helicase